MKVSVVVPAFNEEPLLPACLASLRQQDYDGEIEVIVVDNASTDRTGAIARRADVTVIEEPERGYCKALARGFARATGDIIASTDADSVVPPDWISRLVRAYEPDVVAVGGEIEFCGPNCKARLFTRGILPIINHVDRRNPRGPHLWGANFSVRRTVFLAAGGWDTTFNLQSDTEISERLRQFGRVVLLEDLAVRTSSRRWNRSLVRSCFLFATNFISLKLRHRPLWATFPDIRDGVETLGSAARAYGRWRRTLAWTSASLAAAFIGTVIYDALSPWSSAFGTTHWSGTTHEKVVALTFDDGPNQPYTSEVLDILRREHVRATFFLIGTNVRRDPATAERIVEAGNVVGNHSDTHPAAFALEPPAELRTEVDRAERTIHAATGLYPRLFRPPQGIRSPWLMSTVARDSLVTVTWDDAPRDWEPLTARTIADRAVENARSGSIILLHDGLNLTRSADRSATVAALPSIIERLRARGYRFITVPELLHVSPTLPGWH